MTAYRDQYASIFRGGLGVTLIGVSPDSIEELASWADDAHFPFLFARDGYRCQYCGRGRRELGYRESLTRDHVTPLSRGGDNGWTNVVTACSKCNLRKADRLLHECGMSLGTAPREPNHVELIWAVRRVTPIQARYIRMFYGEDVLQALSG